ATELVPLDRRQRLVWWLGKRIAGLAPSRTAEAECATVEIVGARFGLYCDHPCQHLSEFCVIVLSSDFRLRHRFQGGIDYYDAQDRVAIVGAVKLIGGATKMLSVHHDLNATLRIFGRSVRPSKLRGARSEKLQASKVSIEEGQACDLFLAEGSSHVSTVGLEQW